MRRSAGFTLLELLISIAIFAFVSAMAYTGLNTVMTQRAQTTEQADQLKDLQLVYRILTRDLEQLVSRKVRNEFGDSVDALVGGSGFEGVEFTRAGYPNPAGFLRSDLLRVAYVPDQDQLLRRTWRVLDRAQDSEPDEQVLVKSLNEFQMRFLDQSDEWQERWPPLQALGNAAAGLPKAVEVALVIEDFGTFNWIFRMPQTFVAGAQPNGNNNGGDDIDDDGDIDDDDDIDDDQDDEDEF